MQKFISTAVFLFLCAYSTMGQEPITTIQGRVIDAQTRQGLSGASVTWAGEGSDNGVSSDAQGYFEVSLPRVRYVQLTIRFIGYRENTIEVVPDAPVKSVTVAMERQAGGNFRGGRGGPTGR